MKQQPLLKGFCLVGREREIKKKEKKGNRPARRRLGPTIEIPKQRARKEEKKKNLKKKEKKKIKEKRKEEKRWVPPSVQRSNLKRTREVDFLRARLPTIFFIGKKCRLYEKIAFGLCKMT